MQGDYSRFTFDARKHYSGVLLQQGRVQVDADWNEQIQIGDHHDHTTATDVIGPCGSPKDAGGFEIKPLGLGVADLGITAGRIYVDGLLCEIGGTPVAVVAVGGPDQAQVASLEADGRPFVIDGWVEISSRAAAAGFFRVTAVDTAQRRLTLAGDVTAYAPGDGAVVRHAIRYSSQPDYPNPEPLALLPLTLPRTDLLYLDVWQRHVSAVEDPTIREVALGGPDTATRVQTVCQVKFQRVPGGTSCTGDIPGWPPAAGAGRLTAEHDPTPATDIPCVISAAGGFRGLENRLYRVEIHTGGGLGPGPGAATFKWSRDNGSVVFPVEEFVAGPPARVKVKRLGRDEVLTLQGDDWVEVLDDVTELAGRPGTLTKVTNVDEAQRLLTLTPAVSGFRLDRHPRLRRWDQPRDTGPGGIPVTAGPIVLEDGVQVRFSGTTFRSGDFWAFPARTVAGAVDGFVDAPPQGTIHHYCRLATVHWEQVGFPFQLVRATVGDCRPQFPPLTDIHAGDVHVDDTCTLGVGSLQQVFDAQCGARLLRYVSGDGQQGPPGSPLDGELTVGVEDGFGRPQAGATVTFTVEAGGGTVSAASVTSNATGLAACAWTLGGLGEQLVRAELTGGRLPVLFHAMAVSPVGHAQYRVLRHAGGDGQSGKPGDTLTCPLAVGVEDEGGHPVAGVGVTFMPDGADDVLAELNVPGNVGGPGTPIVATTDSAGLARVTWKIGSRPAPACRRVTASLPGAPQGAPLTVQFHATAVSWPVVERINWGNDQPLSVQDFNKGLVVDFSEPMEPSTISSATFIVTVEPPFSDQHGGQSYAGYRPFVVAGTFAQVGSLRTWRFTPAWGNFGVGVPQDINTLVKTWQTDDATLFKPGARGIRCRVVLKGNTILTREQNRPLDGDVFGRFAVVSGQAVTQLDLPSGDGMPGGDFHSWFWLVSG